MRVHVPKPCDADWDAMEGDERRRLCDGCGKHVHDITLLPPEEARGLLTPGTCVRVVLGMALLGGAAGVAAPSVEAPAPEPDEQQEVLMGTVEDMDWPVDEAVPE